MRSALTLLLAGAAACGSAPRADPAPAPAQAPVRQRPATPEPAEPRAAPDTAPPVDPLAAEAAAVVDRHNAAYNRHDVAGFLATFADSVAVRTLSDSVVLEGKAGLRESTETWFAQAPDARTEVVDRMVLGPFVVDRQRVTGGPEGKPLDAIGIYEVREGLIRRVWTIPPPPSTH